MISGVDELGEIYGQNLGYARRDVTGIGRISRKLGGAAGFVLNRPGRRGTRRGGGRSRAGVGYERHAGFDLLDRILYSGDLIGIGGPRSAPHEGDFESPERI